MGLFQSKPVQQPMFIAPAPVAPKTNYGYIVGATLGALLLVFLGITLYNYLRRKTGKTELALFGADTSSGDKTPSPVNGKVKYEISSGELPAGGGTEYGMQFWMFISDWDYNFGKEKQVVKRVGSTGVASPSITLHPTDNSLQVRVAVFPSDETAGAATPTSGGTGDSFTCTVENVPLQSWFAVSMTVFQRNLDIYINGRLVKSCVLPGVPKPVSGNIIIGDGGGFSGSTCNLRVYPNPLGPEDAKNFFAAGTRCSPPVKKGQDTEGSTFVTLFGYTFRFSTLDKDGKELSSLTL